MTCQDVRARFAAYADSSLAEPEAQALEAHVERCPACAAMLEDRAPPLAGTPALPRSVVPDADLWPGIRARIGPRPGALRSRVSLPRWALAAAAVLLLALGSTVTVLLSGRGAGSVPVRAVASPSSVEAEYASASAELLDALDKARPHLSPTTIATIERSLRIIDTALEESRQALAKDPGNEALSQLVVAAWRQKLDLLRRATALGSSS